MSENERIAPVQGYSAGIPWAMHLRAYDAYCNLYGEQQSLIEGRCRGGFGTSELDKFIPGWREELSQITQLTAALASEKARAESAEARGKELETALRPFAEICKRVSLMWQDSDLRPFYFTMVHYLRSAEALAAERAIDAENTETLT